MIYDNIEYVPSKPRKNLTGQVFGFLKVGSCLGRYKNTTWYLCTCICGLTKPFRGTKLSQKITTSCGCKNTLCDYTHGRSRTREYALWTGIKQRCTNPNGKSFSRYGAKGIWICPRWSDSFGDFFEDLGETPNFGMSLDRIKNSNGYTCGKCPDCLKNDWEMNLRWANPVQQANNRKTNVLIEYKGMVLTLAEISRLPSNLEPTLVKRRLYAGWNPEDALHVPKGRPR